MKSVDVRLIDARTEFGHEFGRNFIKTSQEIPQEFLDLCKRLRDESMGKPMGDTHSVCKVPVQVHERWLREGFDMMKAPANEIVARLRKEHLDGFITTRHFI